MHTSRAETSSAFAGYHSIDEAPRGAPAADSHRGAVGRLCAGLDSLDQSARAATSWTVGTLGLGMLASASYYLPHARAEGGQGAAVGGGLAGLALYAWNTRDILRAAHAEGPPERRAVAHHALLGLAGVAVGTALAGADNPTLGTVGLLGGYFSAFVATSALTSHLTQREAEWAQAGEGALHGNRWLAGGMVLLALGTLGLGWLGAAIGAALTHHSARAVTGRFIGAFVTATAFGQVLPHLIWAPPRQAAAADLET